MSAKYEMLKHQLVSEQRTWLVTGVAGFIGSHLLQKLLELNQKVTGLDNFSTGSSYNLDDVKNSVTKEQWAGFSLIDGDIRSGKDCRKALAGVDHVLHQAALGSIPRSYDDPLLSNDVNVSGFLNMLIMSREYGAKSFVYASSSAVYGNHTGLPRREGVEGRPMSPYAITKMVNESYAEVFSKTSDLAIVGLRYFNVFGPRQNPHGGYAAVIPNWIRCLLNDEQVIINGDGQTSRDFSFVENVVQANLLAAVGAHVGTSRIYNVGCGTQLNLLKLFQMIAAQLNKSKSMSGDCPIHGDFRPGDVRHSLADITAAMRDLGFKPSTCIEEGLRETIDWYKAFNYA